MASFNKLRVTSAKGKNFIAKSRRNALDLTKDLWLSTIAIFSSVPAVVAMMLVLVLAVTHTDSIADGFLHNLARTYPNNAIFAYVSTYLHKFLGMMTFVPVIMLSPKRSLPALLAVIFAATIIMLPPANYYQYLIMAIMSHYFVSSRLPSTRILIIAAFVVYILFLHHILQSVSSPAEHFKRLSAGIKVPIVPTPTTGDGTLYNVGEVKRPTRSLDELLPNVDVPGNSDGTVKKLAKSFSDRV